MFESARQFIRSIWDVLAVFWMAALLCSYAFLGWMGTNGADLSAIVAVACVSLTMTIYTLCVALLSGSDEGCDDDGPGGGGGGPGPDDRPGGPDSGPDGLNVDWEKFAADLRDYTRAREPARA